jgi:aryl-alcohol dehydrogenase-like predicted oxidoreductase
MDRRRLGAEGPQVSVLSFGAMTFGSGQAPITTVDEQDARRMIDRALDAGVNLVDTADVYGNGTSEEILGRVLGRRRDDVLIATKMGFGSHAPGALSYDNVVAACEASLRRLGTDYIDLYQLHRPDRTTPIEETLRALDDLVTRGLVRDIGTSNFRAWETAGAVERQRALGRRPFASAQLYYSLAGRDAEHELLPHCRAAGIGVLVWSPLAGGLLTGRYAGDGVGRRTTFTFPPVDPAVADAALRALAPVATAHEVSVAQVALAWVLAQPAITSVIVGASTVEQLDDNLAAASLVLEPGELAALDVATAPTPVYPAWWDPAMGIPTPEDVATS